MDLEILKKDGLAPHWMTIDGFQTLQEGYLLEGEAPIHMYRRVADSAAKYLGRGELADKFFDLMWCNWLCPATPVLGNCGTSRGLPISCFGSVVPDSVDGIFQSVHETAMLTKNGGGTSKFWGELRQRGSSISNGNGRSASIIPWIKCEEAALHATAQSGLRRGSGAQYYPIEYNEATAVIDLKRKDGDASRRCHSPSVHVGMTMGDAFMKDCENGVTKAQALMLRLMQTRGLTGEPYCMWPDTANRLAPECYKKNGLTIKASNLCNEIYLFSDTEHTFVCCLSSMNVARFEEWKDTDAVELAIWFLDGVMSEFIDKASGMAGMEKAVRFAIKSRALGLGQLGWHTYLQQNLIAFGSREAYDKNAEVARVMNQKSLKASQDLAVAYGEPEWCKGFGIRNTHRLAIAPTMSNAMIAGGVSQGIEPIVGGFYPHKTAKGTFIRKNPTLQALLRQKGKDTYAVWDEINSAQGSVRGLDFLTVDEKEVFATAYEINQMDIIRQAAQRQQFIDQGQSVNIFLSIPKEPSKTEQQALAEWMLDLHMEAWRLNLKGLYYARSESFLRADNSYTDDCKACEG